MLFFVGLDDVIHAAHFHRACISINRLRRRKSDFPPNDWILDSGAFTAILTHGGHVKTPAEYAAEINRWAKCGRMLAAVSQDFMCEPFMLKITGKTVAEHQAATIERYDAIGKENPAAYLMPVLQGFAPADYVRHVRDYSRRLAAGAWVGVGSVCKRNTDPQQIVDVLGAIHDERPDLLLHGFGVKITALKHGAVRRLLYSADSMAWSYAARKQGRSAHDWREAARFVKKIEEHRTQNVLFV